MKSIVALLSVSVALGAYAKTEVEFLSERIVHVRKCGTGNGERGTGGKYHIVTMKPQDVALTTNGNTVASRLVAVAKDDAGNLVFSRPDGAVLLREMRNLTGRVPLMPKWAYGYWISRERYKSWDELLEVLDKHRGLGIPLDGIVQDWRYWGDDGDYNEYWNAMEFCNPAFAKRDANEVIEEIHSKGAHLMITIWPGFGPKTKQYAEFASKGMLMDFPTRRRSSAIASFRVFGKTVEYAGEKIMISAIGEAK